MKKNKRLLIGDSIMSKYQKDYPFATFYTFEPNKEEEIILVYATKAEISTNKLYLYTGFLRKEYGVLKIPKGATLCELVG